MSKFSLIATAAFGLESVVAKELKQLGYSDLRPFNGGVAFTADESAICACNLWLRSADRLYLKLAEFKAVTFEELFQQVKGLPWYMHLEPDAAFPVYAKSVKSTLYSLSDIQAISKKAIADSLKELHGLEWFPENGPRHPIHISILKDRVQVLMDTSGEGLHKRGYRVKSVRAPMKETLAAALVLLSNWYPDKTFVDPFCGSGTIPIEAALIGRNIAPGLNRKFLSESWPFIPDSAWKKARKDAYGAIDLETSLNIQGYDLDRSAIRAATANAEEAGLEDTIHFQVRNVSELSSSDRRGCLVTNPPYGERLESKASAEALYTVLGERFAKLEGWSCFVLTPHERFESAFGAKSDANRKLYNGRIKSYFYQYYKRKG